MAQNLNKADLHNCIEAVAQQVASARRAQNAKRGTANIKQVYAQHEKVLLALQGKLEDLEAEAK